MGSGHLAANPESILRITWNLTFGKTHWHTRQHARLEIDNFPSFDKLSKIKLQVQVLPPHPLAKVNCPIGVPTQPFFCDFWSQQMYFCISYQLEQ